MDDFLEKPTSSAPIDNAETPEDAGQSSDEDDGGPDWTKLSALASSSSNKPAIPKRGDKEFEPVGGVDGGGTGTNLQQHKLERVRTAMFSALDVERTVSSKVASYAIWHPETSRARVLSARGNFLTTMGHSVPANAHKAISSLTSIDSGIREQKKAGKVLEFLPEEALYLVERGSMFCWSQIDDALGDEGTPMTVQQAYAEMIGKENLTLERYQVYAYLKRLGYTVTRAHAPDPFYLTAPPYVSQQKAEAPSSVLTRIRSFFLSPFTVLFGPKISGIDWWRPLKPSGCIHRFLSYSSIFSSLRLIPSGYAQPLATRNQLPSSSYEVFFHLYKPATPYRKTAPPPPDYSVIVVNGRTTPMPSLHELSSLFEQLPELPPPTPRKRFGQAKQTGSSIKKDTNPQIRSPTTATTPPTLLTRIYYLFRQLFLLDWRDNEKPSPALPRRPNPFQILKTGKKMIVIAAVDAGMISFFRFCQGSFEEWPMVQ